MEQESLSLEVYVRMSNPRQGGGLELRESFIMQSLSFAGVAALMARFHELFEQVKRESQAVKK